MRDYHGTSWESRIFCFLFLPTFQLIINRFLKNPLQIVAQKLLTFAQVRLTFHKPHFTTCGIAGKSRNFYIYC